MDSGMSSCLPAPFALFVCCLLACALALTHSALAQGADSVPEVSAALEAGDECSGESSSTTGSDACSLNALQLRGRRAQNSRSASRGYEAASSYLHGWVRERRCDGADLHQLEFVVRQEQNVEKLKALVLDLTDPHSPRYRQWASRAEVRSLMDTERQVRAVKSFLGGQPNVTVLRASEEGELVRASAPVGAWEQLLSTEFHVYRHKVRIESKLRAPDYLLPHAIHDHVDSVFGVVDFEDASPASPFIRSRVHRMSGHKLGFATLQELREEWGGVVTPATLQQRYNVPVPADRGTDMAVMESLTWQVAYGTGRQHWSPNDRTQFQRAFFIPEDNFVHQVEGNGMSSDHMCLRHPARCEEANLDVQYMMGVSPWSKIGYWYAGHSTSEGMAGFLNGLMEKLIHTDGIPGVISLSYGMPEHFVSKASLKLFETLAMKLTARGVTILAASGDSGAASSLADDEGPECGLIEDIGLQTIWPANSWWVTAVGATMGAELGRPEIACSANQTRHVPLGGQQPLITSGGGYSQRVERPPWQSGHHDNVGRGVPDVSLAGHSYAAVLGRRWVAVDGTSASAPAFAGMISLINARLLAAGRQPVGFLNRLLYDNSSASIFTDITVGDNRCAFSDMPCCGGYDAAVGWDPVTGLGVPDFAKLMSALLNASA